MNVILKGEELFPHLSRQPSGYGYGHNHSQVRAWNGTKPKCYQCGLQADTVNVKSEARQTGISNNITILRKMNPSFKPIGLQADTVNLKPEARRTGISSNITILRKIDLFKPVGLQADTLNVKSEARHKGISSNITILRKMNPSFKPIGLQADTVNVKSDERDTDISKNTTISKKKNPSVNPIKLANTPKRKDSELSKHRANIKEVLLWSNATPIRRHECTGYMCCYCKNEYLDPKDLKKHTLENHHDVQKASFMIKISMDQFIIRLDITALQCKICEKDIDTIEQLLEHLMVEHGKIIHDVKNHIIPLKFQTEMLECCICFNTFSKFKTLLQHMNVHYRNYVCEICGAGFIISQSLQSHKLTHETGIFNCDHCQQVFDTNLKLKVHEKAMHSEQPLRFKCGSCKLKFSDYRKKEAHLVSMHGLIVPTAECQACDKVFKDRKELNLHVKRYHLLEKRHKCSVCDMSFFKTTELRDHMVKHTGLKSFHCSVCSKAFSRPKTLREHMKIHDDIRRFKCEYCGQAFVQKCSWRGHMKSKHGEIV